MPKMSPLSIGSHRDLIQPKNTVFAQALQTDQQTDGRMDGQTFCRDVFLTDASKNGCRLNLRKRKTAIFLKSTAPSCVSENISESVITPTWNT